MVQLDVSVDVAVVVVVSVDVDVLHIFNLNWFFIMCVLSNNM